MLKFCSLYSGSSGNCLFVSSNNTKILIDCGTSCKKICDGLASINSSIDEIDAILVTHEHSDHVQSLGMVSKKFNIPVYANKETWDAMPKQKEKISEENILFFENDNGKRKISIATDLGHMDDKIFNNLQGSSFILLESNYDPEILKVSKYPFHLKQRIAGPHGHLSNATAGKTISALMKKDLKEVMLGHLSKENNFPELAYQTVAEELMQAGADISNIKLSVANRNEPGKMIII